MEEKQMITLEKLLEELNTIIATYEVNQYSKDPHFAEDLLYRDICDLTEEIEKCVLIYD